MSTLEEQRQQVPDERYDWDAARARMREEADRGHPAAWQPEQPDDELFGVLVGVNPAAPTRQYGMAPVVEIEDPAGNRWSVWLFHKVLRNAFARQDVQVGETVLIRWLGKVRPDGGGNSYDNYAVIVDRPMARGEIDWKSIGARYDGDTDAAPRRSEPVDRGLTSARSTTTFRSDEARPADGRRRLRRAPHARAHAGDDRLGDRRHRLVPAHGQDRPPARAARRVARSTPTG